MLSWPVPYRFERTSCAPSFTLCAALATVSLVRAKCEPKRSYNDVSMQLPTKPPWKAYLFSTHAATSHEFGPLLAIVPQSKPTGILLPIGNDTSRRLYCLDRVNAVQGRAKVRIVSVLLGAVALILCSFHNGPVPAIANAEMRSVAILFSTRAGSHGGIAELLESLVDTAPDGIRRKVLTIAVLLGGRTILFCDVDIDRVRRRRGLLVGAEPTHCVQDCNEGGGLAGVSDESSCCRAGIGIAV